MDYVGDGKVLAPTHGPGRNTWDLRAAGNRMKPELKREAGGAGFPLTLFWH